MVFPASLPTAVPNSRFTYRTSMSKVEEFRFAEFLGDCLFVTAETRFFLMGCSEILKRLGQRTLSCDYIFLHGIAQSSS